MPTQGFTTLMDRVSGDSGQPQILSAVGITAGLLVFTFGMAAAALTGAAWLMAPVLAIALVTAFSVRVAKQWERGAVLRIRERPAGACRGRGRELVGRADRHARQRHGGDEGRRPGGGRGGIRRCGSRDPGDRDAEREGHHERCAGARHDTSG